MDQLYEEEMIKIQQEIDLIKKSKDRPNWRLSD